VEDTEETAATEESAASTFQRLPWMVIWMVFVDIGAGVAVGSYRDAVADGIAVTMALLMATALFVLIRKPPSSTGRGGGTAIDYGLGGSKRRTQGPSNRRQRRRK
jgi:threonine/homoserine efflux transporter RhtA